MKDFFTFHTPFSDLNIQRDIVIQKLGGGDDNTIAAMQMDLDHVFEKAHALCDPTVTVKILKPEHLSFKEGIIQLKESFHIGRKLCAYLNHSEQIAVFICTIGPELEEWSRQLIAEGDVLKGYIADTLGSVTVDQTLSLFQKYLKEELRKEDQNITNSYSPGYCGWDVMEQHKLFSLMPEEFNLVSLTESALMTPVKSISGFIGIGADVHYKRYRCDDCTLVTCVYREDKPESL